MKCKTNRVKKFTQVNASFRHWLLAPSPKPKQADPFTTHQWKLLPNQLIDRYIDRSYITTKQASKQTNKQPRVLTYYYKASNLFVCVFFSLEYFTCVPSVAHYLSLSLSLSLSPENIRCRKLSVSYTHLRIYWELTFGGYSLSFVISISLSLL